MPAATKPSTSKRATASGPAKNIFKASMFKKASTPTATASGRGPVDTATWELIAARQQMGEKANELTGNIYCHFKPRACSRSNQHASPFHCPAALHARSTD